MEQRFNKSGCGIVQHLPLNAIASFLNITPQMLSRIRKAALFTSKL